ncbi:MAG: GIY-YIG nuclease family protein [Desulfobulbaceae bacterium]|nr:GIY-YIG nuclease family protein [Desulfobulbaceae bacterium]
MAELSEILSSMNFPILRSVQGRASIADMWPTNNRCGIYVLQFHNGEVYAGQALDVTRRYVQHSKTHNDISNISFKKIPRAALNDEERAVIWELEQKGLDLRNIIFTSIPKGDSDFYLVMSPPEQQKWLIDLDYQEFGSVKAQDDTLRRKYHPKFQRFIKQPQSEAAITLLRRYAKQGIPFSVRSELSFWGCSCLPSYGKPGIIIYSRININWQEVLTVITERGTLIASFHLALSPLEDAFGNSLDLLFDKFPSLRHTEHFYEPGGHDQLNIEIEGIESAMQLLEDPDITKAIRLFNLRLMKKGPCAFSRFHCMDLADRILSDTF